jgi:hypothetical protein
VLPALAPQPRLRRAARLSPSCRRPVFPPLSPKICR